MPIMNISIIYEHLLATGGKGKKLVIIIWYKSTSEPPADFMRTLLHRSAELSRISSLKARRPYL